MSCPWMLLGLGTRVPVAVVASSATCAPPAYVPARTLQCRRARQCCIASRQRLQVVCMAHPRRVARVSSQIQREIGDLFVADPVIQAAICPERKGGGDMLSAVASITNTYVSNDLQVVKVYVSVYSDDYGKRVAMQNLSRLEPYVRRVIGQRVQLRRTPEVRFVYDDSEEEADLVYRVIGREEVERYRSEIEADMTPGAGAAAGTAREGTAAERGQAGEGDGAGDEDEEAEEDEEDEEDWETDFPEESPQQYPNPFGDLFVDVGDDALEVSAGRRGKQSKAAAGSAGRGNRGRGGPGRSGRGSRASGRGGRGRGGVGRGQEWEEPEGTAPASQVTGAQ